MGGSQPGPPHTHASSSIVTLIFSTADAIIPQTGRSLRPIQWKTVTDQNMFYPVAETSNLSIRGITDTRTLRLQRGVVTCGCRTHAPPRKQWLPRSHLANCSSASSPTISIIMSQIDSRFFPHIRDCILDAALEDPSGGVIPMLRLTAKAVRDYINKRTKHVVHFVDENATVSMTGRIALSRGALLSLAPFARVLDLHYRLPPSRGVSETASPYFPNMTCVRLHRDGHIQLRRLIQTSGLPMASIPTHREVNGALFLQPQMRRGASARPPPGPTPFVAMAIFRLIPDESRSRTLLAFSARRSVVILPQNLARL